MAAARIPLADRFWSKVLKTDTCWLWKSGTNSHGYGRFQYFTRLERPGLGRDLYAHRVAWLLTNGPIEDGLNVLHHCDNPPCVNPAHLFLGTQTDNMQDCGRKGRASAPPIRAKLSEREARAIRSDARKHHIIAADYGVGRLTVWNIKHGRTWKQLA